jgi:phosphoglycolate phosphatase-like HAD superfamily hydrolase
MILCYSIPTMTAISERPVNLIEMAGDNLRRWDITDVVVDMDNTLTPTRELFDVALMDTAFIMAAEYNKTHLGKIHAEDIFQIMIKPAIAGIRTEFCVRPAVTEMTVVLVGRWLGFADSDQCVIAGRERVSEVYTKDLDGLYPGTIETIDALNSLGLITVLGTHAGEEWTWRKRIGLGLTGKFREIHCFSVDRPKAEQWPGFVSLRRKSPRNLLSIGDNFDADVAAPVELGCRAIHITEQNINPFSIEKKATKIESDQSRILRAKTIADVVQTIAFARN